MLVHTELLFLTFDNLGNNLNQRLGTGGETDRLGQDDGVVQV
jgi:hypothetical protein